MMDFTEWVLAGHTRSQFDDLIDAARLNPVSTSESIKDLPKHGEPVSLLESQNASREGKALELANVTVMGKVDPAYSVPRRVEFNCDQGKGDATCNKCPMRQLYNGETVREYAANAELPRSAIDSPDEQVRKMLKVDVRARCSDHLEINIVDKWNVEHLIVTDSIESKREASKNNDIIRSVYSVGTYDTPTNVAVRIVGEQVSNRKDQRGQLFAWLVEEVESSIDKFRMTPELHEELKVYQVQDGETVMERLKIIAEDNAHHVSRIFGRPSLHIAVRLTCASPLQIRFLGKAIKGYLSGALPGDSRTGKSDVCTSLIKHWRVGYLANCDQASLVGLVGGMQTFGNSNWVINWGLIPQHDRRFIVFDEAGSLANKDILPAMSSVRSAGVAEIVKIRTAKTNARIREIFVFNSIGGSHLAALPDGAMQAMRELFPNHEDIARFDWAMPVGRDEVPTEIVNSRHNKDVPDHVYTSDIENALMLWCWSRTVDQVKFARGVEDYILEMAKRVGERYSADFPLIQSENAKDKFARGAASVAMAVFSTNDGENVIVRKKHVDAWVGFLDEVYSSDLMGYRRMSIKRAMDEKESLSNVGVVTSFLHGEIAMFKEIGPPILKGFMSVGGRFEIRVLAEASNLSVDQAMDGMRWLEDKKMVRRTRGGKWIEPLPALTRILRDEEGTVVANDEESG